jgi:midasin
MQDNTLADRPMVELLTMLMHMLDLARHRASQGPVGNAALQQLVLILADGRFHEKESLRRVVEVHCTPVPLAC